MSTANSVCRILAERHRTDARPCQKVSCPFCGHKTFSIKRDDSIAKCFHPACGRYVTAHGPDASAASPVPGILKRFFAECHRELLALRDDTRPNAWSYCVDERGIHPRVLEDSMVGVVPRSLDVDALFRTHLDVAGEAKDDRADKLRTLYEARDKFASIVRGHEGSLAFFCTDEHHEIRSIRFRKPYSKEFALLKMPGERGGVFNHGLFRPYDSPRTGELEDRLIVTEGEFNTLQLQSVCAHEAESRGRPSECGYVHSCAVGGVHNVDVETIRGLCSRPIVAYDNDESGAGFELVNTIRRRTAVRAFTTPGTDSDLDNHIRSFGDPLAAHEAVRALIATSESFPRDLDAVKDEVDAVRRKEGRRNGLRQFEAYRRASEIIVGDLKDRGCLYRDGPDAYLFVEESGRLLAIDPGNAELELLISRYGIARSEKLFQFAVDAVRLEAIRDGTPTRVHTFAHYDRGTEVHYLSTFDGRMLRTRPDGSQATVDNGNDGVLFIHNPAWEPFEIGEFDPERSHFNEVIVDTIPFEESELTVAEQRLLFWVWFLGLLFPELFPTRPILVMLGERGSGKTTTLRKIGQLLFGSSFNVTPLTQDPKDFDAAITNEHFVAIDNADARVPWLNDRLAIASTGATLKVRRYYTNNELVEYPVRAFLGITSRTPHFTREDVADRLLIFKVGRIPGAFRPESHILNELSTRRNAIMTEIAKCLRELVPELHRQSGTFYATPSRMADLGDFAMKYAHALDPEVARLMASILDRLASEQATFTLEDDPVPYLIDLWLSREDGENVGRAVTSNELREELIPIAEVHRIDCRFLRSTRSFAGRLKNVRSSLLTRYQIVDHDKVGNLKRFSFHPLADGSATAVGADSEGEWGAPMERSNAI